MKRKLVFLVALFIGVGIANAAVRDEKTIVRTANSTLQRSATSRQNTTSSRSLTSRANTKNTTARKSVSSRGTQRSATARSATTKTAQRPNRQQTSVGRSSAINMSNIVASPVRGLSIARASNTPSTTIDPSTTLGADYTKCRDAYFACMDQFCAVADESYRRCACSSRLTTVQSRERALVQAAEQLTDFKNLNLEVINKSSDEVKAMISASVGELAQQNAKDTSDSAKQLSGINAVLEKTKRESLATQGSLDIAGDINEIWSTTDLAGGVNISNLTGEALYNAVHAQCAEMVDSICPSTDVRTMIVSAYGMYIENDCSLILTGLDKKLTAANATIRDAEYEMGDRRLENYNAHNSTSINDCIARVRMDITADTACGKDYVHCLDVTGRYLNYDTGEPIYSAEFFQLNTLTSLSGDLLKNQTNRLFIERLNSMRQYAQGSLDTCRDIADDVWDEFMRQSITEIHQGQQERIRMVKEECLDVVNTCYDEQNQTLKDFSNTDEALLLGSRLELSEQLCKEKMNTCSNLYGGGPNGMAEMLTAMHDIVSQQIAQQCLIALQDYSKKLCAVSGKDTLHAYPYGCRAYTPGTQEYAIKPECNNATATSTGKVLTNKVQRYTTGSCGKHYTYCNPGYYMVQTNNTYTLNSDRGEEHANTCLKCPENHYCKGGGTIDGTKPQLLDCGADYVGSLYYKLANYANEVCVRPSKADEPLPHAVLQDINVVMDQIRADMSVELAKECERLGGKWVTNALNENDTTIKTRHAFYSATGANTQWGYCAYQ